VVFIKHCDTATFSFNGSAYIGEVAKGLTTALDLQETPVYDLSGQGAQIILTFILIPESHFQVIKFIVKLYCNEIFIDDEMNTIQ
jgi:hypothetical protein